MAVFLNNLTMKHSIIRVGAAPSNLGGSIFFDGSTYLQVPASSDWTINTDDFTVEWFLNQTNASSFPRVFQFGTYPTTSFGVSIEGGTIYVWMNGGIATSTSITYNAWHHTALTRSGGIMRLFIDGVMQTEEPESGNIDPSGIPMTIGADPGDVSATMLDGNFTNFNYVVGTALYTSNFTPPTAPISASAGTKLLLLATNAGGVLTDSSTYNRTVSVEQGSVSWQSNNPF